MNLTPEDREVGRSNYYDVLNDYDQLTHHRHRRGFLKQVIAAGGVTAAGIGALYFGYGRPANPVRVAVIGTGDEGNVLIGSLNPNYVEVKAICDIRPSSIFRAFHGDWSSANAKKVRKGLIDVYGFPNEDAARKAIHVEKYDYREVLKRKDIDAVIIALPLFLHAKVAVDAMRAGKHVLTEKLMAHNIAECKWMGRVSDEKRLYCATGHQRHYSILYDNAINFIKWGLLGEIHHIRAQWHRGNLPGRDSWSMPLPGGEEFKDGSGRLDQLGDRLKYLKGLGATDKKTLMQIRQWSELIEDGAVSSSVLENAGYGTKDVGALEELIRWRIWDRTGGGLMAELGSHQLDASSIFISALSDQKILPLTVHAAGGRHTFPKDRDADDHVYCTFEFPGPGYEPGYRVGYQDPVYNVPNPETGIPSGEEDPNKRIIVTYSSINGNGYGGYGEVVMGTKGTLVLEKEKDVLIYKNASTSTKVGAQVTKKGEAVLDTTQSGDAGPAQTAVSGPVSRGYAEQIEHWAYCIASNDWGNQPRCSPTVALADAVMALTARLAIKNSNDPSRGENQHGFIRFKPEWFDVYKDEVPEPEALCSMESVKKRLEKDA